MKRERCPQSPCPEPHPAQRQALQPALEHSVLQPVRTLGPHKPLTDWRFLSSFHSLEGHKLTWEAVSRSHPQGCPSYLSTTNITSFFAGLDQGYFYWEPRGSGSAASLGTDTSKHGIQQWHSGHGHNSWSDFHTCFHPEKKGPSDPFFQAPDPSRRENLPGQENYGTGPALTWWKLKRNMDLHWLMTAKLLPESASPNWDTAPPSQVRVLWSLTEVWVTRTEWQVLVRNCFFMFDASSK